MQIIINKSFANISDEKIIKAVTFASVLLMSDRLCKSISIEVCSLHTLLRKDVYGCSWPKTEVKRPKHFIIELNRKNSLNRMMKTIFHEMAHVKQFAKEELLITDGVAMWKKKTVSTNTCYWLSPHEIEAHGIQNGLTALFQEFNLDKT